MRRNQQPTHSPVRATTTVFILLFTAIFHLLRSAPLPPCAQLPPSAPLTPSVVPSSPNNKSNDFGWPKILNKLSRRRGYLIFSRALASVIPSISVDLQSVTIFAPLRFMKNPGIRYPLEEVVRYHMVPGRYGFFHLSGLASASNETWLMSLAGGRSVKLTSNLSSVACDIRVNDVKFSVPDLIVSKTVVVHGISRKLDILPPRKGQQLLKLQSERSKKNSLNFIQEKDSYAEKAMKRTAEYGKAPDAFKNNQAVTEESGKTSSEVHDVDAGQEVNP